MTATKALLVDLIGSLLSNCKKPEDLIGENSLLKQLTKALVERASHALAIRWYEIANHQHALAPWGYKPKPAEFVQITKSL